MEPANNKGTPPTQTAPKIQRVHESPQTHQFKDAVFKTKGISSLRHHKQTSHRRNTRPNKILINIKGSRINSNPRQHGTMDYKMARQQRAPTS